jgi:hypothetical protein
MQMNVLRKLTALAALVGAATAVEAQSVQLQLAPAPPANTFTIAGFYVGPFAGTLLSDPTLPTVSIFSVDLLNAIAWGQQWQANVSNLGQSQLGATRYGSASLDTYRKAAWLSSQLALNTSVPTRADIQVAIWSLFTPNISVAGFTGQGWVAAVNALAASSAWSTFNWGQYSVLTDVNSSGLAYGGGYEFITESANVVQPNVTPEPATWILLGTGLVAVIGFALVRGARV